METFWPWTIPFDRSRPVESVKIKIKKAGGSLFFVPSSHFPNFVGFHFPESRNYSLWFLSLFSRRAIAKFFSPFASIARGIGGILACQK